MDDINGLLNDVELKYCGRQAAPVPLCYTRGSRGGRLDSSDV